MLAPTTILVQQHERTFKERLGTFAVRVESLSRFTTPAAGRRNPAPTSRPGEVDVLVGTHALLGSEVLPRDLGLVVVDEEQRFGVRHKERIKESGASVDVLTLTATPIPRTMQMGLASLRDISVIETPPAGRRSILTHVGPYEEDLVKHAIEREVAREGQTFFVHNRVESIDEVAERLRSLVPGVALRDGARPDAGAGARRASCGDFLDGRGRRARDHDHRGERARRGDGEHPHRGPLRHDGSRAALPVAGQDRALHRAGLRLPLRSSGRNRRVAEAPGGPDGLHGARQRLRHRDAGPGDPGRRQPARRRAVRAHSGRRLRDVPEPPRGGGRGRRGARRRSAATERPVIVELPLDAYLPPGYVMDEIERVDLYRRASGLGSLAEVEDLAEELADRFGELPEPAMNLLGLSRVKLLAREAGASSVTFRSGNLAVTGVTAGRGPEALMRKATGGTVTQRGRARIARPRAPNIDPLTLAEETPARRWCRSR